VISAPGKGTTFEIVLRAASGKETPLADSSATPRCQVSGRASVLIVDDEQMVLRMAKLSLEREGYHVYVAASGAEAIRLFEGEARGVGLVVLDLSMPGMNGQETLAALQDIDADVRAVISSGYSKAEALRSFGGRKVFGYLQKPYKPSHLASVIRTAMEASTQRRAS
jgi:CheY-like chemotaxis protein